MILKFSEGIKNFAIALFTNISQQFSSNLAAAQNRAKIITIKTLLFFCQSSAQTFFTLLS
jgi:hypothetical protein